MPLTALTRMAEDEEVQAGPVSEGGSAAMQWA
jgi:hypothetical protein